MGARSRSEGGLQGACRDKGTQGVASSALSRGAVHACCVSGSVACWIVASKPKRPVHTTGERLREAVCNAGFGTDTRAMCIARPLSCSRRTLCRCSCSSDASWVQEEPCTMHSAHAMLHWAFFYLPPSSVTNTCHCRGWALIRRRGSPVGALIVREERSAGTDR